MHRGRPGSDHHLRKIARNLLPEPAVRLLLPRADQPALAGKSRAGGSHHRAEQDRAADYQPLTWPMGHGPPYSAAAVLISAGSARTAQNLNSGILPNGSSAGLVTRCAAASA